MKLQAIVDIAEICFRKGITHAVLSPGSRCAPLTLAFVRHPGIKVYTISDERSAAFIGVGIAQQLKTPVVLVCTSGSAAYNYAPAVAEAFFRNTPLLILTADRPPEWIDQWDGQTIRQQGIYGQHIKNSFQLQVSLDNTDAVWHAHRTVSEAINCAQMGAPGPVHINVPLREPFYPEKDEPYAFSKELKIIDEIAGAPELGESTWQQLVADWLRYDKKLVVAGQSDPDSKLQTALTEFLTHNKSVLIGDIISNVGHKEKINKHDIFLGRNDLKLKESLRPELLITYGQSLVAKNLKLFLREYKPKAHWHISSSGQVGDTFQGLTKIIRTTPEQFFTAMTSVPAMEAFNSQKAENFYQLWQIENRKATEFMEGFFPGEDFSEFEAINAIVGNIPSHSALHLANSMTVRYVNLVGKLAENVRVFANRGTSGIDGSNSTAVGAALVSENLHTLITGDMAFFYDRNAFWHNYPLSNLRVIMLNNHGGGIFRLIGGPSSQPELEEYFETRQQLDARNTAADFGFEYEAVESAEQLNGALEGFFEKSDRPKLLEITTKNKQNQEVFKQYKNLINNNYGK